MPVARKLKGKDDEIIAAVEGGERIANIAKRYRVTEQSIYALLARNGIRIVRSFKREIAS